MQKSDSERVASVLEKMNYKKAERFEDADLIVVNMCSIRQSAVDRIYGLAEKLKKLKEKKPNLKTILTGCILEKDKKNFLKKFDFVLDIKALPYWGKILSKETFEIENEKLGCAYLKIEPKYSNNFSAFVPISNGCSNFCSYCVVPFVRGPLVCRDHKEILNEAKNLVEKKFKEIWLLGQNVADYISPSDSKVDFGVLLEMINEIKGNFWIRFTSPNPTNFSLELVKKIAILSKVTPYLNLPVQSGDDEILKKMNRKYTVSQYKELVKKIRKAFKKYRKHLEKEVAISTDVIVGFPGEKRHHFENTKKLFKQIGFFMAYIAKYSPRPQTLAFNFKDDVPPIEKEKRQKELTQILEKTALKFNKKFLNKVVRVLVHEKRKDFYLGKTRHFQTIKFSSNEDVLGKFVRVKVKKITPFGLEGKFLEIEK